MGFKALRQGIESHIGGADNPVKMMYFEVSSCEQSDVYSVLLPIPCAPPHISSGLFASSAFASLLRRLTGGHRVTGVRRETRRFRPGQDYTVAHHGILPTHALLVRAASPSNRADAT